MPKETGGKLKENMRLRRINSTIREQKQEQEEEQDDHNVIRKYFERGQLLDHQEQPQLSFLL